MSQVDHLVYGVPDLEIAVDELERRTGVRAVGGGRHVGRGTWNALAGLDDGAYLEIIAPDPSQDADPATLPFDVGRMREPRLVTWAVGVIGIEHRVARTRASGYDPGEVVEMGRERPDGVVLRWRLTRPDVLPHGGVVPFLIDWGDSPHPSTTAPPGLRLVSLTATHPFPERVMEVLARVGVDLDVTPGSATSLTAVIDSPHGPLELR